MSGRKFSILLVSHSYPPVLGGSEVEAQRVCAALLRRGHRVQVVCAGGPPMPETSVWVDPYGVPVRMFGSGVPERWRDRTFAVGVARMLIKERKRIDLVYFLMQGLHLAAGLPVARYFGIPVVMKFSGSSIISMLTQSRLGRLELRWLQDWAKRVMVLNEGMKQEAMAAGFRGDHLLWMPNPVDVQEYAPCSDSQKSALRAELGVDENAYVIVFVGRLAPEKELRSLIGAFSYVARQFPQARLVLIGDGPERSMLEESAGRDPSIASSIRFTGRLSADWVRKWLQASDVFALVSSQEGFPCSLVEAMSAGLPSVVSDIPANRQLIFSGENGFTAELKNEQALGSALSCLAADSGLRLRLGTAAREHVTANYSTDKVAERYETLFAESVEPHGNSCHSYSG
jgi:glycosyltransferase involved in cell wall biosynthesis